jgi:cytochrome oxidase assembly protein ShyY1
VLRHPGVVDPSARGGRRRFAPYRGRTGECGQHQIIKIGSHSRIQRPEPDEFHSVSLWRLAVTPRWWGILGFTVVFAVACVGLGQWQFDRRAQAQAAIALLDGNYDQPVVDLTTLITDSAEYDATEKWRTVRVTGEYLASDIIYVRTRSGPGGIGFEQLAPLQIATGEVFVVNRGWVPANGDNSAPAETPFVPSGPITVTVRLIPGEQEIAGRDAPDGQIATIHLQTIEQRIKSEVYSGWYGRLATESPTAATGARWEKPVLDEGPHLSYALQWYVFALMGFYGYGWALRKEARGDVLPERKVRASRSDEEIEDAALDATPAR